ncbi:hypothetical protein A2U01_0110607, partial [Trifolium medium]|nr:hypothetical protein [Trifolium medium]
HPDPPRFPHL